jgi:hypothetical protein
MKDIFRDIVARGIQAIDDFVADATEETLHLEFKSLGRADGGQLVKDDRRLIAKSLCGLCNAEGGLLVVGVGTERRDNIDVAVEAKPIAEIQKVRNRVVSMLGEALNPQHQEIAVEAIEGTSGSGFLAIYVDPSDNRPHMSVPHHQYFRRGSEGTRVLEHSEVRDLMLAPKQARVGISQHFKLDRMTSDRNSYDFYWVICLHNEGMVPVRAPFIMCNARDAPCINPPIQGKANFDLRISSKGRLGIYGKGDLILHVDDELELANFTTGIDFNHSGININSILDSHDKFKSEGYSVGCSKDPRGLSLCARPFELEVRFGAENAAICEAQFKLNKWDMYEGMARTLRASFPR